MNAYSGAQRFGYALLLACGIEFGYWTAACGFPDIGGGIVFGAILVAIGIPAAGLAALRLRLLARSTSNSILLGIVLVAFPVAAFLIAATLRSCVLLEP